jgi:hypothetical protein
MLDLLFLDNRGAYVIQIWPSQFNSVQSMAERASYLDNLVFFCHEDHGQILVRAATKMKNGQERDLMVKNSCLLSRLVHMYCQQPNLTYKNHLHTMEFITNRITDYRTFT